MPTENAYTLTAKVRAVELDQKVTGVIATRTGLAIVYLGIGIEIVDLPPEAQEELGNVLCGLAAARTVTAAVDMGVAGHA